MNEEIKSVETVIAEKGYVVISTSGISMMPMLRDRKDTSEIRKLTKKPKKYDVVLFRKGTKLVLHRIIKETPDGYIIRGDNSYEKDTVKSESLIGVLYSFTRKGKQHTAKDLSYRIYSRLIVFCHPFKRFLQKTKAIVKRIFRWK